VDLFQAQFDVCDREEKRQQSWGRGEITPPAVRADRKPNHTVPIRRNKPIAGHVCLSKRVHLIEASVLQLEQGRTSHDLLRDRPVAAQRRHRHFFVINPARALHSLDPQSVMSRRCSPVHRCSQLSNPLAQGWARLDLRLVDYVQTQVDSSRLNPTSCQLVDLSGRVQNSYFINFTAIGFNLSWGAHSWNGTLLSGFGYLSALFNSELYFFATIRSRNEVLSSSQCLHHSIFCPICRNKMTAVGKGRLGRHRRSHAHHCVPDGRLPLARG
jgi:hypothetical protein